MAAIPDSPAGRSGTSISLDARIALAVLLAVPVGVIVGALLCVLFMTPSSFF